MPSAKPRVSCLVPVFGSNRMLGHRVGELLKGCPWVGIPFGGGLSELPHIDARTICVSDAHRHIINLSVAAKEMHKELIAELDAVLFHPDVLGDAQQRCRSLERNHDDVDAVVWAMPNLKWAVDYFICAWMARNGTAATDKEFEAGMSIRWEAGGGDSAVRFRNATESLKDWHELTKRCTFVTLGCFEFLDKCKDTTETGIYCDPPWPDDGEKYKCAFSVDDQCKLANLLSEFQKARVVVRFGDHPLIREIYPESHWEWHHLDGRTSANKTKKEVLLVNRRAI